MKKTILTVSLSVSMLFIGTNTTASAKPHEDFSSKVDVGKVDLFVNVQGSENRDMHEPAVVFESGYGDDSSNWNGLQAEISEVTQTLSYDRVGLGQSGNGEMPKDAEHHAKQLHKAIKKSKIKAPYVIVAHSIGGINARVYAEKFGDELDGIVFIDSSHESQEELMIEPYLPEEMKEFYYEQFTAEGDYETVMNSFQQALDSRESDPLRTIPITVLSATEHGLGNEAEQVWAMLQQDIASLSDHNTHITVEGAGHYIHLDQPKLVIDEIVKMID
ncbi:alpha/beta fold hydrolase [Bacillus sp. 2205SS5-2]|uniref:alpha/beta fold hydrolase n=1 Tax=Bacillus sp. 2205SS5-2 TaxID=3109031 RepID=UPI0030043961